MVCGIELTIILIDTERNKIIQLLKNNGFVQVPSGNLRTGGQSLPSNVENQSFNTYAEVESFVNAINSYDDSSLDNSVKRNINGGRVGERGRVKFVPCDDQGTFYINLAKTGQT